MGAISGQWSLNETVTSISDILRASTSDNVQTNALLVVQAFGVQLAVSETTRRKIEIMSRAPHLHFTIKFLKSKVGYAKGDSAEYLSQSDGGIRFLSLASALLCTSNSFFAASALHSMIVETSPASYKDDPNGPGLPTVKMLQQLLEALDHRLAHVGFATYVAGFQISLGDICPLKNDDQQPSMELVKALVEAFRSTHRLGTDGSIEIRAYSGIPWIAAFTQWTLEEPPSVVNSDGKTMIETPSRVTLCINADRSMCEEVKIMHKIRSPDILWSGPLEANHAWSGMLTVKEYGKLRLAYFGMNTAKSKKALGEAIMFSIPLLMKRLWTGVKDRGSPFHPALGLGYYHKNSSFAFPQFRTHMFGKQHKLETVLAEYLDIGDVTMSQCLEEDELQHFPNFEMFLEDVIAGCRCDICLHNPSDYDDSRLGLEVHKSGTRTDLRSLATSCCGKGSQGPDINSRCAAKRIWAQLISMTVEILALSLYDCTEDIKVYWPGASAAQARTRGTFFETVFQSIICNRKAAFCHVRDILELATMMIGHKVSRELNSGTWIASAFRGQVIYPCLFEIEELSSDLLVLGGGPGQLLFQDSKPDIVVSKSPATRMVDEILVAGAAVDRIEDLYSHEALNWRISQTAQAPELFFGTPRCRTIYNPHDVLETLSRSLFVHCKHPEDTPLDVAADDCVFTPAPRYETTQAPHYYDSVNAMRSHIQIREVQNQSGTRPFKIQVLPTAGNEGLRLFAMCSPWPGVVRDKACLQCCIEVCRKSGLEYIVL